MTSMRPALLFAVGQRNSEPTASALFLPVMRTIVQRATKDLLFALVLIISPAFAYAQARTATLVLTNGHIVTVDSARPEAQAVAITGDRVLAVGTNAEIKRFVTPTTTVIDLEGRLAVPGFIDGHGH